MAAWRSTKQIFNNFYIYLFIYLFLFIFHITAHHLTVALKWSIHIPLFFYFCFRFLLLFSSDVFVIHNLFLNLLLFTLSVLSPFSPRLSETPKLRTTITQVASASSSRFTTERMDKFKGNYSCSVIFSKPVQYDWHVLIDGQPSRQRVHLALIAT